MFFVPFAFNNPQIIKGLIACQVHQQMGPQIVSMGALVINQLPEVQIKVQQEPHVCSSHTSSIKS